MTVVFANDRVAVCIKPVGADAEHDVPACLSEQLGGTFYTVHRLDRPVGGLMVYARSKQAAAQLCAAIQSGDMIKEYRALVHGTPPPGGTMEDLLFKDSRQHKVFVVKRERRGVKKARLDYTCLQAGAVSEVHVRLHTGRTHQIRVQFASRGFPLVGDRRYGAHDSEPNVQLFSCRLTFPLDGETLTFEATPPWAAKA